jgi:pimeloyl-ACP methyl ester carboxylesterase
VRENVTAGTPTQLTIDGVQIEVAEAGEGRSLLFLHGMDGIDPAAPWLRALSARHRVIAPWQPGFGHSERPAEFRSIADLAYFQLELAEALDLRDAVLIGASFGGWVAAEVAVRSTERFSHLVLIDPLGIKVGGRMQRHITDMHALSQEQLLEAMWHDPARGESDYSAMDDRELLGIARSRESFTYFGWKPYMNNPGLRRWLRRVRIPTLLVWGESDGIVGPEYARACAAELPDARLETIAEAGHYPHLEQPERFVALVEGFLRDTTPAAAATNSI